MINSYFKLPANRPSNQITFIYRNPVVQRNNISQQQRKYKVFIILICRATYRQMRQSLGLISLKTRKMQQLLNKMAVFSQKNMNRSIYLSFQNIKIAAQQNKKVGNVLKSVVNLLQRMQKYKLKACFNHLILRYARSNHNCMETFYLQRGATCLRKLALLFKNKKREAFNSIITYNRFVKSFNKVRVVSVIHKRFQKHLKQQFFTKLTRFLLAKNSQSNIVSQMGNLKNQLQDMSVQLQNKNENISRLQSELSQIKIQKSNLSVYQNLPNGETNRSKSQKMGKSNKQSRISCDSLDGFDDMSIGSLLGNLSKQRSESFNKYDQNTDCSCGYKHRCIKYKALNQSLKNQLQIVKEELQVAKDLNQHLANEIKDYVIGGNGEDDYQKLKKQFSIIQEEREHLREKLFKYQKHIVNLKAQFKLKMEEIYRKVRKDM